MHTKVHMIPINKYTLKQKQQKQQEYKRGMVRTVYRTTLQQEKSENHNWLVIKRLLWSRNKINRCSVWGISKSRGSLLSRLAKPLNLGIQNLKNIQDIKYIYLRKKQCSRNAFTSWHLQEVQSSSKNVLPEKIGKKIL